MKPRSYPFFILAAAELFLPSQSHAADVVLSSAAIGSGDNDANVGLSSNKTYLNAVNIQGGALTINGVNFEGSSGANPSGTNYAISGVGNTHSAGSSVGGQLGSLVSNFIYNGNPSVLTLNNLTAGETYTTTFYNRSWDTVNRTQNISTTSGGNFSINQDFNTPGELNLIRYTFTAGSTSETINFTPESNNASFHFYGFSTEQNFNTTHTGGANWSNSLWSGTSPAGVGSNAAFASQGAPNTVNLDTNVTLGHVRFSGTNTWTLSGASILSMQADVGAYSVLSAQAGSHEITAPVTFQSAIQKSGAGTLTLSGPITSNGHRVNLGDGTLGFTSAAAQALTGEISGTGNLAKSGSGTLTLSGPVNHTGSTVINSGTLEVATNSTQTLRSTLSGGGTFLKSGSGTLTINQPQNHTGPTQISTGSLRLASGAAPLFTDNFAATGNPNTYDINYNLANRQTGTAAQQSWTGSANVQVGNDTNVNAPSGTNGDYMLLAFGGQASLNGLALSSGNVSGPVKINFDMFTGTATNPTDWTSFTLRSSGIGHPVAGSGELGFLYRTNTGIQIFNNGGLLQNFDSTSAGDNFTFYLADSAGTGSPFAGNGTKVVVMQGSSVLGTYALNTGMGTSYLSFGSTVTRIGGVDNLAINNFQNNLLNPSTPLSLTASGATLELDGVHQTVASLDGVAGSQVKIGTFSHLTVSGSTDSTFAGDITGANGSLTKSGSSTLTLSGTNTYTGATTVSAGRLFLSGSLGNTAVTVNDGAEIAGGGTITGTLTLSGNALLDVMTALQDSNPLDVAGMTTFGSGFGIDNLTGMDWDLVANGTYTLINGNINTANLGNLNPENKLAIGTLPERYAYFQSGSLQLVVIPEPASALLSSLGALALLRRRRNG